MAIQSRYRGYRARKVVAVKKQIRDEQRLLAEKEREERLQAEKQREQRLLAEKVQTKQDELVQAKAAEIEKQKELESVLKIQKGKEFEEYYF